MHSPSQLLLSLGLLFAPGPDPAAASPESNRPVTEAAEKPPPEVSPLVPPSQLQWLSAHPVELEKIQFKPGKGLTLRSKSGAFELTTGLRAQFLYALTHDNADGADPRVLHSFEVRRARLVFSGHMFGEHNKFKTEISLSPKDVGLRDGSVSYTVMRDFYFEFDYLRDLSLRIGQYKLPYSLQRVISSGKLQMVDRAMAQAEFEFDRDIGLDLYSEDFLGVERLRYHLGMYMGGGRDAFTPESPTRGGLVYIARLEVLPFGLFDDYVEGDFTRTRKPRWMLGAAYSFMDDAVFNRGTKGSTPSDGGTTNIHNVTGSTVFKLLGWSLSGEFFWRHGTRRFGDTMIDDGMGNLIPAPREAPRNGLGWYLQSGYMIPRVPLEIVARYGEVRPLGDDTQTSVSERHELGGGFNWYPGGHAWKLQLDYFRLWGDELAQGEDQLRLQAQIAF